MSTIKSNATPAARLLTRMDQLLRSQIAHASIILLIIRFFFFNDTATTEIYTLSLHDALPILARAGGRGAPARGARRRAQGDRGRSEEHTSELQSPCNLVCRLLLEKKKNN